MTSRRPAHLATRLFTAQVLVIAVGALTLLAAALIVAPALFHYHLGQSGEADSQLQRHTEDAFTTSIAISLLIATTVSLIAAGLVSWFIVRRVADPVERLADVAEIVATGDFDVEVPAAAFSSELSRLGESFQLMAHRLADNERIRRQLLSDLAHELRTPLSTLEAYVDGLEDGVLPIETASFDSMREQIARLHRLSTDLREVALAEEHALSVHLTPVNAADIVRAAVATAAPRYEAAEVHLTAVVPPAPVMVQADAVRMQQVLSNLLDNALRHCEKQVAVKLAEESHEAVISVVDDGDGIPTTEIDDVFLRFHRGDPSRRSTDGSGSGLGLTIARAIVEEHGGTLTAASPGLGQGANFTARIPSFAVQKRELRDASGHSRFPAG